ncbi:MAG: hypothetical protein WCF90_08175 [Methanomicrobiales archaeon]
MGENGWMDTCIQVTRDADIAVIEGVMGMYDGVDGSDLSSTAHVALISHAHVILVVDAKGMSRSVHALADGSRHYEPSLAFSGVILNRIVSPQHRSLIEPSMSIPSFDYIPRTEELAVESRHLGLRMAHESGNRGEFGKINEENCDLDVLLTAAGRAPLLAPVIP